MPSIGISSISVPLWYILPLARTSTVCYAAPHSVDAEEYPPEGNSEPGMVQAR
jgi:hypothetical protein